MGTAKGQLPLLACSLTIFLSRRTWPIFLLSFSLFLLRSTIEVQALRTSLMGHEWLTVMNLFNVQIAPELANGACVLSWPHQPPNTVFCGLINSAVILHSTFLKLVIHQERGSDGPLWICYLEPSTLKSLAGGRVGKRYQLTNTLCICVFG